MEYQPALAAAERLSGFARHCEPFHVTDPGQLFPEWACDGAGQQPMQRRPDHIGVDELAQPQGQLALAYG